MTFRLSLSQLADRQRCRSEIAAKLATEVPDTDLGCAVFWQRVAAESELAALVLADSSCLDEALILCDRMLRALDMKIAWCDDPADKMAMQMVMLDVRLDVSLLAPKHRGLVS